MNSQEIQSNTFFVPSQKALNQSDFFLQQQIEIPELGIIIFGLDSTLPPHIHQKIILLLKNLSDNYYLRQDLTDPVGSFEKVLAEFNNEFNRIFSDSFSWTKKLDTTVALLLDNFIHFSNYGSNHLLLLKQKNFIDVIRHMSAHLQVSPKKIFDQFYSGSIEKFQRICLCNQATFDYLNTDNLKYIFNLLPIANITPQLEQLTEQTPRNQHISGTILQLTQLRAQSNVVNQITVIGNTDPLKHLIERTTATQKILRPQIFPNFTKIKNLFLPLAFWRKKQLLKSVDTKKFFVLNNYLPKLKDLPANIENIARKTKHKKNNILAIIKNLPNNTHFSLILLKNKFNSLPTISKILLILSLLLLITLTVNISLLGIKRNTVVNSEYFDETVNKIYSLHSEAQAAIIYNDNIKAKELLKEAQNLIYNLPKNNEQRQSTNQELLEKNTTLMAEANKVTIVQAPVTLLTLDKINSINLTAGNLQILDNNLYLLTSTNLIRISTNNREINEIPLPFSNPTLSILEGDALLILNNEKKLFRFQPENNSFEQIEINLENINLISGQIYNGNLYGLQSENNQIIRFNKAGKNFNNAQNWLSVEPTEKIFSLAIDGSIYSLIKNVGLVQFIRGKQTDFKMEIIEPNLNEQSLLVTTADFLNLYILDVQNKRFLTFNKEGKLLRQYYFPDIPSLNSFAINPNKIDNKRIIYLKNDQAIYEISVEE